MPYYINVECTNCGYSESIEIPEGIKVEEYPCPACHTKSLIKKKEKETSELKES